MRMLSKHDVEWCDFRLFRAKCDLQACIKAMKGKYGTKRAVSHAEFCLSYIDDLITDYKYARRFYQQFRNPPNTPKSRRLGWHKKGENK